MSSRALRKLQREQELQKQLAAAKEAEEEVEESEDEEPEPVAASSTPRNAFDMLEDAEEDESEVDDEKTIQTPAKPLQPSPQPSSASQPSKSKKKRKKAKKKARDTTGQSTPAKDESRQESGDEIDRALKELSAKRQTGDATRDEEDATISWEVTATKQLAIDTKNLNPTTEMRSLFGNIALEDEPRSGSRNQTQRRREQNQQGGVDLGTALTGRHSRASHGKELGNLANRRNIFMQGKEEWPLASSGGLSMEFTSDPSSFERQYNIIHNNAYQEVQREFRMVVESMDPERMIALLIRAPYHIATLLQVSEIAKHQGDHSVSGDLLERALFSFGRSVHSSFGVAMRDGTARMPFERASNRELYLTIWRYIRNLEQRGTWKTAFEWSKLLLQLNTLSDPYGVTLMIDQLALRGRSHEQLLRLGSDDAYGNAWRHLPNIQISLVLAHLRSKQGREARKQLALCIHHYPYIVSAMASALDISPIPKSLWAKIPSTDPEKLYTELYVSRAKDLWNTPETSALIVEVADTLQYYSAAISSAPPAPKLEISLEEARHIMLLETPQLIALLPRRFSSMHTASFDVLPPPNSTADSDFTARAPMDGSGVSIMQNIMNAGASTAGATGNTIMQSILNFRNWFNAPATRGSTEEGDADEGGQAALADLRRELGQQGMSPGMIEHFLHMQMTDDDPGGDAGERMTLDGLGMANGMVGGWDYYADAHDNNSTTDDTDTNSMPELEDIPTQDTRPAAAPTPPPQQQQNENRNPRAAMVEEDEEEDSSPAFRFLNPVGRGILRHVDSDSEDEDGVVVEGTRPHPRQPTHTLFSAGYRPAAPVLAPVPTAVSSHPTSAPQQQHHPVAEPDIENDPQRLQRWLLTTGLSELQAEDQDRISHAKMATYVRRMRILRRQQQEWIFNMIGQRGGKKEFVERIRGELRE